MPVATRRSIRRILRATLLALAVGVTGLCGAAFAEGDAPTTAQAAAGKSDDDWQPVDGRMGVREGESFQANRLVAAAYGFIWLAVAGFVFSVWRRTGSVERELSSLRKEIDARTPRR